MTVETAQDVYDLEPTIDIYEVLGISRDASPVMAQTMYWSRIAALKKEEETGDLEARRRINELNLALEIILDPDRRADYEEYEEAHGSAEHVEQTRSKRSEWRRVAWQAAIAVVPGAFAGLLSLIVIGEPFVAVIVAAAPVLAAALIASATGGYDDNEDPLDVLELAADASPDKIDLAYRTLASVWLSRVGTQPEESVRALDRLDGAYAQALEQALEIGGFDDLRERSLLGWLGSSLGLGIAKAARSAYTTVRWTAGRALRPLTSRAATRAGRRVRGAVGRSGEATAGAGGRLRSLFSRGGVAAAGTARRMSEVAGQARDRAAEELDAFEDQEARAETRPTVDIERRLRASIQAVAQQAVEQTEQPAEEFEDRHFRLVLDSAAGSRRVPVYDHPVRIGASESSDIMVDPGDAAAGEDTLIWVSGGELVLHTAPGGLTCRVNDEPVTWARLDEDDIVSVGDTSFRVEFAPE